MTRISLAALLVLAVQTPPGAPGPVSHPFVGVTYVDRVATAPRAEHMHIVQVDLTAPGIRVALSPPAGGREVVRQSTLAFLTQEHAQIAINAHFFLPFPSADVDAWVIGLAASNGRVYSAFESPEQSFALVADAPALNIDPDNRASIVHRDPRQADGLHVLEPVRLWTALAGSAQIVTDGAVTIPAYADAEHPRAPLTPGSARHFKNGNSWYDVVTARSAIGLSRDSRTLTLFTVDAKGDSSGMAVGEVAALLIKDYGVWNALNLDGGGSTSLAMADPKTGVGRLVNTSSDNAAGRTVASSLAIFASR